MADKITRVAILDKVGLPSDADRYGFPRSRVWSMPEPYRHHHVRDLMMVNNVPVPINEGSERFTYGFTTEDRKFLTREDAEKVARESGQLTKPNIGGPMTSEDLW